MLVRLAVASLDVSCLAFDPNKNSKLFGHFFGFEFVHDGHSYVRAISPFEFVSCFCLTEELTYKLLHPSIFCLDAAVPSMTSARIFKQIYDQCIHIQSCNFEIFEPNQYAAPAACVQAFLNGMVGGTHLPDHNSWVKAYTEGPKLSAVVSFVKNQNPGTILQHNLKAAQLNAIYCQLLWQWSVKLEDSILFYHEPIASSGSYAKLQLVPTAFRNIVFIAFHSNPLGGHHNATMTFHWICLRFYWLHMYTYIAQMSKSCPGCTLTNPTRSKSEQLMWLSG